MCPHTGSMFNLTLLRVGNYCLLTREITFCNYDCDCELTAAKSVGIAKIRTLPVFAILIVIPSHVGHEGQFCELAVAITITKISNVNRPLISAIQSISQSLLFCGPFFERIRLKTLSQKEPLSNYQLGTFA